MKIEISKIPPEGYCVEEDFTAAELDLETEEVKFPKPLKLVGTASKITNTVTIDANVKALMQLTCGRCLKEFTLPLEPKFRMNYVVDKNQQFVELDQDIREELILRYPFKSLCKPDCKGLCPKCGKDLNAGKCNCKG